jgi:hypothetical protein
MTILRHISSRLASAETAGRKFDSERGVYKQRGRPTGNGYQMPAKQGLIEVDIVSADDHEALAREFKVEPKENGFYDLHQTLPNIVLKVKGKPVAYLTWEEAYSLGFGLQSTANLAYFG